jgi:hypothetical protein
MTQGQTGRHSVEDGCRRGDYRELGEYADISEQMRAVAIRSTRLVHQIAPEAAEGGVAK